MSDEPPADDTDRPPTDRSATETEASDADDPIERESDRGRREDPEREPDREPSRHHERDRRREPEAETEPDPDRDRSPRAERKSGRESPNGDGGFGWRWRLKLGGGIVVVILLLSAIGGAVVAPDPPTQSIEDAPDPEESPGVFTDGVVADRIAAEGNVTVSEDLTVDGGHDERTVLIEETRASDQSDIRQLVRATTMAGHDVQLGSGPDLESSLEEADAYVLVAPREGFSDEEVEAITEFTDDGGRLILLGSPDLIQLGLLGGIATVETDMRRVAGEYGIVFGNRYLFDTADNDANHRQIFAEPAEETPPTVPEPDADRVVLSTATHVDSSGGTVLLRTPETTKLSEGGEADAYPVAVADGNVLAVGDTEFLAEPNHNVADNEEFTAYVVEFALGA